VTGVSTVSIDVTDRERNAVALRDSEQRYALAARATSNAIREWDLTHDRVRWNEGVQMVFGYAVTAVDATARWWTDRIHPDDRARVERGLAELVEERRSEDVWSAEYRFRRADDTWATVVDRGVLGRDAQGRVVRMVSAMEDVTHQRELEEQLRQVQKMEAVGQLAGGVAHDFNNLLTIITGNLELVQEDLVTLLSPTHPVQEGIDEIASAAERARTLVRQLLLFSRKQPLRPQLLDVREVVRRTEKLLRRLIGEEIMLTTSYSTDVASFVRADAGQLEQVLMNLAVNARDAMLTPLHGHAGDGGSLEIDVDVLVTPPGSEDEDEAGEWVRLLVRDTGHGMSRETVAHVFEPFFTTKEIGGGTGLGLATVFGIVRQAGGTIRVDSAPGAGTQFTILLPRAEPTEEQRSPEPETASVQAEATVLLVEDESALRAAARRILERRGYRVLEARHGTDALLLWDAHGHLVDAVITDIRMPEMGGRELVARLRRQSPQLPVVLMSGYSEQVDGSFRSAHEQFVEKPFTAEALLQALAQVLASRARAESPAPDA
jgi:two-component system, cell cycle sensor histidine kinase and response regulator CckA